MADRATGIPIVREGLPFVVPAVGVALVAWGLGWPVVAGILGSVALFIAWFFRNPHRQAPHSENLVVAPGDGRVLAVDEEYEPRFLKKRGIRISIFLDIFNVHVNRIPCAGTIVDVVYQPGTFFSADHPEATVRNEQNALMIHAREGAKVLCVQVAGLIARRIVCWAVPGETVACGERFGLIRFGSRMDMYLPLDTRLHTAVGDCVKGGETILGELSCAERQ